MIVFRPLWLFPATAVARAIARRRSQTVPYGWRETTVVSWAGMRGVVTVATALALPANAADGSALWWRETVVLVGLGCVLVTLTVQGLTLTPIVRALKVGTAADERGEILELRERATLSALEDLRSDADHSDVAVLTVIKTYQGRLDAQHELLRALDRPESDPDAAGGSSPDELEARLRRAFRRASDVERELVLAERAGGRVSSAAADEVLLEIEGRASRTTP